MKERVFIGIFIFFLSSVSALANEASSFSPPVLTPSLGFTAEYDQEKNTVHMSWEKWQKDFMWYKVIRSQVNPDPVYPEDGYIYYSDNPSVQEYTDRSPPRGKTFYRICAITFSKDRYCSNVVSIDTSLEDLESKSNFPICIQVVTPAKNPQTGVCKEFPTPCDVPDDWDVVDICQQPECIEGEFYAEDPENSKCQEFKTTCEIPQGWIEKDTCDEELLCDDVPVSAVNASGICKDFPSSCEVPENWTVIPDLKDCRNSGSFSLSVREGEESALVSWDPKNIMGEIIGYKILKSTIHPSPVFPPLEGDEFIYITNPEEMTYEDKDLTSETVYYRICAYQSQGLCFPYSDTFAFTYSKTLEEEGEEDVKKFSDISPSNEIGEAVLRYANDGVVQGFSDGSFKPEKGITRAEMAKIATLAVHANPDAVSNAIFCDVSPDEWFAPYVQYFFQNGFAEGFVGGDCPLNRFFSPHNPVLRSEALKMMFEVVGVDVQLLQENDTTGFSDVASDHWLAPYAKKAWEMGVFRGFDDGTFRPDIPATRGEVLLYFKRIQDAMKE